MHCGNSLGSEALARLAVVYVNKATTNTNDKLHSIITISMQVAIGTWPVTEFQLNLMAVAWL